MIKIFIHFYYENGDDKIVFVGDIKKDDDLIYIISERKVVIHTIDGQTVHFLVADNVSVGIFTSVMKGDQNG